MPKVADYSFSSLLLYYRHFEVPREPRNGDSVHIGVQTYRRILYKRINISIFDRARGAARNRARSKYEKQMIYSVNAMRVRAHSFLCVRVYRFGIYHSACGPWLPLLFLSLHNFIATLHNYSFFLFLERAAALCRISA